jgi:hypothetical protein
VATENVHLEEAILGGDEALREDEVVEGLCADVGDAVSVALDGDGSGEAGHGESAVNLGKLGDEKVMNVASCSEEACDAEDKEDGAADGDELEEAARAARLYGVAARTPGEEGWLWIVEAHR